MAKIGRKGRGEGRGEERRGKAKREREGREENEGREGREEKGGRKTEKGERGREDGRDTLNLRFLVFFWQRRSPLQPLLVVGKA